MRTKGSAQTWEVVVEIGQDEDGAAEIWAAFCGEPVGRMRKVLDMLTLVGDLDEAIQEDMLAFFDRGVQEGYFDTVPGKDISTMAGGRRGRKDDPIPQQLPDAAFPAPKVDPSIF